MNETSTAIVASPATQLERVLIGGDLSQLKPDDRVMYYKAVCESVGLNPLTKPFEYITLNGKLTLYARRDATDQLRNINKVSITIRSREIVDDCYVVTARAVTPIRQDESIGAVSIANLKGEARANAMMKAETKAKRRVTLSICGLGMLDETEVETIPGATKAITPTAGVLGALPAKIQETVIETANQAKAMLTNDQAMDAYALWQDSRFDADEEVAFFSLFDSKQRSMLKRLQEAERAAETGKISPAQKKRLEARIGELKLDRDQVKAFCKERFLVEHFTDLTIEQYETLDSQLESMAPKAAAEQGGQGTATAPSNEGHAACLAPYAALKSLETTLNYAPSIVCNRLMAKLASKGLKSLAELTEEQATALNDWVQKEIDKAAEKTI